MYAGQGAKMQVGKQANWSTAVAQTQAISFTRENLRFVPQYKQVDVLLGRKGPGRMDILGTKVEGDFGCIAYPDEIGILIGAVMGAEATPAAVSGSAVYDHVFTPMSALAASSLPSLTITVDRITAINGYIGSKLDSMTLEARKMEYLRASFSVIGYDEAVDTIDSLSPSTLVPFNFTHGAATVATVAENIEEATIRFNNNLENDLYTLLAASAKMIEINPQRRECSGSFTMLYDTAANTVRTTYFKAGTVCALAFTFTSTETAGTGLYYTLTVAIPLAYITKADTPVGGPDRIKQTCEFTASESASANLMTITLRNAAASAYI